MFFTLIFRTSVTESMTIPLLANNFLHHLCCKNATKKEFAPETLKVLKNHSWPGNVLELCNLIERAFYLALDSKVIRCDHLSDYIINPQPEVDKQYNYLAPIDDFTSRNYMPFYGIPQSVTTIRETEEHHLRQILTRSDYNISRAASLLGISRSTLYRKINKYKINTK